MQVITEQSHSDNDSDRSVPVARHSSNLKDFLQRTKDAFKKDSGNILNSLPEADGVSIDSSESASLESEASSLSDMTDLSGTSMDTDEKMRKTQAYLLKKKEMKKR